MIRSRLALVGLLCLSCSVPSLGRDRTTTAPDPATTTAGESTSPSESAAPRTVPPTTDAAGGIGRADDRPGDVLGADDRIVVQIDDRLALLTGRGLIDLPDVGAASQPAFSDDGSRLAWSVVQPDGAPEIAIATIAADGSATLAAQLATPTASFYTAWKPGSTDRLSILGNTPQGVGVAQIDVVDRGPTSILAAGIPFYFAWNGADLIAHNGSTFELVSPTATRRLGPAGTLGRTPVLVPDPGAESSDESTFFAVVPGDTPDGPEVIGSIALDGSGAVTAVRPLASVASATGMVISPDGSTLAVVVSGGSPGVAVVAQPAARVLDPGLHLYDLDRASWTTAATGAVLAAFWSPDSQRVASLSVEGVGAAQARWTVYDRGGELEDRTDPFDPSPTFLGAYVPFFDQYALSSTVWAPASDRFVFAGRFADPAGGDTSGSQVWIHRLPGAREPGQPATVSVAEGEVAFWSPRAR